MLIVERPLRLKVCPEKEIPATIFKRTAELNEVNAALAQIPPDTTLDDWTAFAKATKLKAAVKKNSSIYNCLQDECAFELGADYLVACNDKDFYTAKTDNSPHSIS